MLQRVADDPRKPVVGVDGVGGALLLDVAMHALRELRHDVDEALLGQVGGPGGDVDDPEAAFDVHLGRQVVGPRPHVDVTGHAGLGQRRHQLPHVDVHATAVARAGLGQGGRVERDDRQLAHRRLQPPTSDGDSPSSAAPARRIASTTGAGTSTGAGPASSSGPLPAGPLPAGPVPAGPVPVRRPRARLRSDREGRSAWPQNPLETSRPLGPERLVDVDEGPLVVVVEVGRPPDRLDQVVGRAAALVVEHAGPHVQGLGRDVQRAGELLEDAGRRSPEPPLDLAQVGVGDPRQLGEAAQGQLAEPALLADVLAELPPAVLDLALHRAATTGGG